MMEILLAALIFYAVPTHLVAESTPLDSVSREMGKRDINYFFDSISFERGTWKFELSRNSMGLLWRTRDGDNDVTGVCSYKQTVVVPKDASFEIKNKDISLSFRPIKPYNVGDSAAYTVWLRVGAGEHAVYRGGNATDLILTRDGTWIVVNGED